MALVTALERVTIILAYPDKETGFSMWWHYGKEKLAVVEQCVAYGCIHHEAWGN